MGLLQPANPDAKFKFLAAEVLRTVGGAVLLRCVACSHNRCTDEVIKMGDPIGSRTIVLDWVSTAFRCQLQFPCCRSGHILGQRSARRLPM